MLNFVDILRVLDLLGQGRLGRIGSMKFNTNSNMNFEIEITLKTLRQVKLNTVKLQAVGRSTIQFWEPIQSTTGKSMV